MLRECKQCGKSFYGHGLKLYCTNECHNAIRRKGGSERKKPVRKIINADVVNADARAVRQSYGAYVGNTLAEESEEMNCSKCGGTSKVYNTAKTKTHVYRERVCTKCPNRWFTEEYENNSPRVGLIINQIKETRRYERENNKKN